MHRQRQRDIDNTPPPSAAPAMSWHVMSFYVMKALGRKKVWGQEVLR